MNFESIKFLFLKHVYWILPTLVFLLLIGTPIGLIYGFQQTERVWDNLAYINGDQFESKFDSLFFETTKDLDLSLEELRELQVKLKRESESWPVSLLTNFLFDTLTNSGTILLPNNLDRINYTYNDSMVFDKKLQRFRLAYQMKLLNDSLPLLDRRLAVRVDSLTRNMLDENFTYIMSIEEWVNPDTIRVTFVREAPEEPPMVSKD